MNDDLERYRQDMQQELTNILAYWVEYTVDLQNGGFVGKVDNDNNVDAKAPKGSVLNSRILWSFSAAYNLTKTARYLQMAERAYKYISNYFIDKKLGGVYWTVNYRGEPLDTKKQIYALSFAVYGLSEYFIASEDKEAKKLAIELYKAIVEHSYDKVNGGYIEALTRDWKEISDLRLSAKDANEKKSMNTHLHVLEGFTTLYKIWPDAGLKQRIEDLINIFLNHIINHDTNHLILFFDEEWNSRSNILSYGHDIEAAWLIQEAAEAIKNKELMEVVKERSVKIADAASEGLDNDGGLWYEYEADKKYLIEEKHSWPQAESMVGFYNAWQITRDKTYLQKSLNSWKFIRDCIKDKNKGEWYWGVNKDYSIMQGQDKAGLWKCPYHNSRACIEIIHRISSDKKLDSI
jgi:cellobiose epimerase